MDIIKELQRQLAAAQEVSNTKRISERNCIDLVTKLLQTDRIKLVHTTSGKEWLTLEQLDREIRDALAANGGRINVTDIPNEVGVAVEHCEVRVELMRKKDCSLSRVHGDLLSSHYLQGVAQEIEEGLEEAGCLAVSDLATKYNLPADFIRERVLDIISAGSQRHVVKQNAIYTGAHVGRVQARVRGALRGCTQPVALAALAARHRLDADLVAAAVQQCLRDGSVQGKLQGSTFTPKSYSDGQSSQVDSFFIANGYLPLAMAKSSGISVKDWAKDHGFEGVSLSSVFVADHIVETAHASIAEALHSDSWVDARPLLPSSMTAADAHELLQHLATKRRLPTNSLIIEHVAMSKVFLKVVAAQLEAEAKATAERSVSSPSAPSRGAKKAAPAAADGFDDDKRKGRRTAKGKKGRDEEDEDDVAGGGGGGGGSAGAGEAIDGQVVRDMLAEKYPEVPEEIHDELCGHLQPLLAAMVAKAETSLRSSLQSKQKTLFDQTEKFVQERYEQLALGLRALESTKLLDSPLHPYLLREVATEPLHRLLSLRWEEAHGTSLEVTAANLRRTLDKLVAKAGAKEMDSLVKLAAALTKIKEDKDAAKEVAKEANDDKSKQGKKTAKVKKGDDDEDDEDDRDATKDERAKKGKKTAKGRKGEDDGEDEIKDGVADILELLHAAANDCHIFCRKVDKKREKAVAAEQRAAVREQLRDQALADAELLIQLCLRATLLADSVVGFVFPAEPWALRLVAESLGPEAGYDEAVALLETAAAGEDVAAGRRQRLEAAVAALRARALGVAERPAG